MCQKFDVDFISEKTFEWTFFRLNSRENGLFLM